MPQKRTFNRTSSTPVGLEDDKSEYQPTLTYANIHLQERDVEGKAQFTVHSRL